MLRSFQLFDFQEWVQPQQADTFLDEVVRNFDVLNSEHDANTFDYVFDQLMLGVEEHNWFAIDLRGEVDILGHKTSQTADGDPATDVSATVEGIDGKVIFRTAQAPSGRWRVYQVIVPGGDETMQPWAVQLDPDSQQGE